jgi:hypothetical protein
MSDSILFRLPRFDSHLSDAGADVSHDADGTAGQGLAASDDAACEPVHSEFILPIPASIIDETDADRIVQNISTALQALEAQSQTYLQTRLYEIASYLFPKLAETHFSAEILAQVSQIAGRLPSELIVRVSPELAEQLGGQLEAAAGRDTAVTLETSQALDFSQIQLRWGAGGGDFNLNTMLDEILQIYAPSRALEEI